MIFRILFVGESWLGSCARSLKEALGRHAEVLLDEVHEDLFIPKPRGRLLRAVNRILRPMYRQELYRQILSRVAAFKPDIVMTYKGHPIDAAFVRGLQALGCTVVNVYPDCSPHAHGAEHKKAVAAYDLVISTKRFHPALWHSVYGYENHCVFVAQGYDPLLHLVPDPPGEQRFDIALVATWRPEYGDLMRTLADLLRGRGITVGIGGNGWIARRGDFPADWILAGEVTGRAYVEFLRAGRICLAPMTGVSVLNGASQPGDEDTTRTYELAAAHCFFMHRRTSFVRHLYDEETEVPMYDTADELAQKILRFLSRPHDRAQMAAKAHARAVPAYSIDSRADEIATLIRNRSCL